MANEISKLDAMVSLRPTANIYGYADNPIWGLENNDGLVQPTDAEVEAEKVRLQADYDAKQYQRDREYPSIQEQLDMQYHDLVNGTTTWKDAIAQVKADNPKPSE